MIKRLMMLTTFSLVAGCASAPESFRDQLKPGTAWVAYSDEWRQEALDVYAAATMYVQEAGRSRDANTWAVVLDVDETILNNVNYQVSRELAGLEYTPESWYEWTQEEAATLVPGAKDFIEAVNRAGGIVALVTNRSDTEQLATENNLSAVGIERREDFRILLTRARPASSNKVGRFDVVDDMLAAQGLPNVTIIAFVGDGKGDRPPELGDGQFFCIDQGAMYGEPCAVVPGSGT
ncbi:MAG: HAD family acid phosphatase [Pseudomonadota bacterium]